MAEGRTEKDMEMGQLFFWIFFAVTPICYTKKQLSDFPLLQTVIVTAVYFVD